MLLLDSTLSNRYITLMILQSEDIKCKAIDLGFDLAGVTHALPVDRTHAQHFDQWLTLGHAGSMAYMHQHRDKRLSPALLHPVTQSIVIVGLNYKPARDLPDVLPEDQARVAHYAWYPDYHKTIKGRLHALLDWILTHVTLPGKARVCVDSAPVAERSLAHRAGLGFIGKNHMLIHPDLGPEFFLGELFLPLPLAADQPMVRDCARCRLCMDACPTGALQEDGFFNASRCINALAIEHKGPVPNDLANLFGDRVYGCDQCVKVCPYTQKAPANTDPDFRAIETHRTLSPEAILAMDQAAFDQEFHSTPIHRLGLEHLQRNARIVIRNRVL